MKKLLIIDRDGTLIIEPEDEQIDSLEKLEFYPGVISNLSRIQKECDYELVMVTNQDGLGTDSFPESDFWPTHKKMMTTLGGEDIEFSAVLIDRSFPEENNPGRKPGTAMLTPYMNGEYNLSESIVIGDRISDVELAKNLNAKAILLDSGDKKSILEEKHLDQYCMLITSSWNEIHGLLTVNPRKAEVIRNTNETEIAVEIDLDGDGKSSIETGISFFDHMLDQIARHGSFDLNIKCAGDLHVDEHHTIEDVAITLGQAFDKALGSKKGIERYGFLLPMDDSLAQVALDFGGRSWLVWEAEFKREKIGEMPTEMFYHFFKSFSDHTNCNLNIKVEGSNEHHKIESIFKAFAKALRMACHQSGNSLPSTKGVL